MGKIAMDVSWFIGARDVAYSECSVVVVVGVKASAAEKTGDADLAHGPSASLT
jgi:hypothetical protein